MDPIRMARRNPVLAALAAALAATGLEAQAPAAPSTPAPLPSSRIITATAAEGGM